MSPVTDQVEESVLTTAVEMMIVITVGEVARETTEAGEMTPATGLEDGRMILLT